MSTTTDLQITTHGHVTQVDLCRPPHNFFDHALIRQLADVFDLHANGTAYQRRAWESTGWKKGRALPRQLVSELLLAGERIGGGPHAFEDRVERLPMAAQPS